MELTTKQEELLIAISEIEEYMVENDIESTDIMTCFTADHYMEVEEFEEIADRLCDLDYLNDEYMLTIKAKQYLDLLGEELNKENNAKVIENKFSGFNINFLNNKLTLNTGGDGAGAFLGKILSKIFEKKS